MSYLKATKSSTNHRFSLEPQSDTTSSLFPPIKTVIVSTSNTLGLGTINYVKLILLKLEFVLEVTVIQLLLNVHLLDS